MRTLDAARVLAGRRADDAPEVPIQLALIVEADLQSNLARLHASCEQLFREPDPEARQVRVGWHADLRAKRTAQVKLVEVGVRREIVERHRLGEPSAKELDGAAHRSRVLALRVDDARQRFDSLGDGDLEGEAIRASLHGVVEALQRQAALVLGFQLRMNAHVAEHALHGGRRERDDLARARTVARDIAADIAGLLELERARTAPPDLAAAPPLRAPGLDAGDHVRLLHPHVELVDRPPHGADAGGRADREGIDTSSHALIVGRAPADGLGNLGSTAHPFDRPRTAKPAYEAGLIDGVMQNESSGIEGKVVAITGASSGIGAATALLLAARGAKVVLGARRPDRLEALVDRITKAGGDAVFARTDVKRRDDLSNLVELACERYGKLDVLANNAGIGLISRLDDLRVEDWEEMIDVNIKGVLYGIAAALPVFRRQGFGHFVNTVSTAGLKVVPLQSVYAGTKNAVRAISEGLRQEAGEKLRVTVISPGFVRTDFAGPMTNAEVKAQVVEKMNRIAISPEAIARAIAFAIEQPADVDVGEIVVRPTAQD